MYGLPSQIGRGTCSACLQSAIRQIATLVDEELGL